MSRAVRNSEWVVIAFLAYAAIIGQELPVPQAVRDRVLLVNVVVALVYAVLIRRDYAEPRLALSVIRDWLPLAVVILAYREMGLYALPHPAHQFESHLVSWDRSFLHAASPWIESLGPALPALLESAYALIYTMAPFAVAALYLTGRRESVDRFLFVFTLGVLFCYAQFPFWPSEPPRVVFRGEDIPLYETAIRRFNLWMLSSYGIHTSVFPSAHVAGAFAAAAGMKQAGGRKKWIYRALFALAALIALATVYGRYHYLADALAGLAMGCLAGFFGDRWLNPKPRAAHHTNLRSTVCLEEWAPTHVFASDSIRGTRSGHSGPVRISDPHFGLDSLSARPQGVVRNPCA